jgi:hypothetical protein
MCHHAQLLVGGGGGNPQEHFCPGWDGTSVSQVSRIADMTHWCSASAAILAFVPVYVICFYYGFLKIFLCITRFNQFD